MNLERLSEIFGKQNLQNFYFIIFYFFTPSETFFTQFHMRKKNNTGNHFHILFANQFNKCKKRNICLVLW